MITLQRNDLCLRGPPVQLAKTKKPKKREKKNKTNDELDKIFPLRVRLVGSNS
jgi:hypothetical protein